MLCITLLCCDSYGAVLGGRDMQPVPPSTAEDSARQDRTGQDRTNALDELTAAVAACTRPARDQTSQHSSKVRREPQKLPPSAEEPLAGAGF